jgi:hypothetical protein
MMRACCQLAVALALDLPTLEESLFPGGGTSQLASIDTAKQFKETQRRTPFPYCVSSLGKKWKKGSLGEGKEHYEIGP